MKHYQYTAILMILIGSIFFSYTEVAQAEGNEVKIIVKYKDKITAASKKSSFPVDIISTHKEDVQKKVAALKKDPDIEYIEMDTKVYSQGEYPNDNYYDKQEDTLEAIHAQEGWETFQEEKFDEDTVVAVIDSGVQLNHPDLKGQLLQGRNFVNPDQPPEDHYGHGTHVAGLISALTNNEEGVASVSHGKTKILPVKIMEANEGNVTDLIDGITYAVDQGADVINLSLGTYNYKFGLADAIQYAQEQGVLVVGAAGNDNRNETLYPAALEGVLAVGSFNTETQSKASFSNYGSGVDVVTPGEGIWSTYKESGYEAMDGTSMSTGHVSSLAALLMENSPYLTGKQVGKIIQASSTKLSGEFLLGNGMIHAGDTLSNVKQYQRISGSTSVETSVEVSQEGWTGLEEKELTINGKEVKGKFVILATAKDFPDSLAASPLASYLNSPVLLELKQEISPSILKELERLDASDVLLIGGTNALSKDVQSSLASNGYNTHRIFGEDRYQTAVAVNQLIPFDTNKAFIVSGQEFPDALSASGYSAMNGYPVLYVRHDRIPGVVNDYMKAENITKNYIVGGSVPVSEEVEKELPDANPLRIAGEDRYETNYQMHRIFGNEEARTIYFVTGRNFPDAMAAAPLAVQSESPVMITHENQEIITRKNIQLFDRRVDYHIVGGTVPIPAPYAWKIDQAFYQ
ncbi:S8 family serine peptidase [Halobacillus sp. Nhm2S1]|uniref:S8 family serine peptidase n=1 Tax=Halobacillus sp. Nhm2S1 TaxID=2866716 RepID=UPI001C73903F|nr:S8 family serine peptidase [Halobacillus sp. Nhm2S1]MBX0357664.1 S8 family serine peptidase [Halobacillus sp. Nhm2S1]